MNVRTVLLVLALAGATPVALAREDGVRDVLLVDRGGPHVWIALEATPRSLQAQSAPGRLVLDVQGLSLEEARRIVPVNGAPLRVLTATPLDGGAARLVLEGAFTTGEASIRQGGVWIALDGRISDPAPAPAPAVAAATVGDDRTAPTEPEAGEPVSAAGPGANSAPSRATIPAGTAAAPGRPASAVVLEPGHGAPDLPAVPASEPQAEAEMRSVPADPAGESAIIDAAPEAAVGADPDRAGPCDATAAAVQESPWDLDALTRHADCLVSLGPAGRDNAAGLYERVLAFDPTHFRAAIGLARIREAQGRGAEAARLYERAASAAMTDGEALAARAAADRNRDDEP